MKVYRSKYRYLYDKGVCKSEHVMLAEKALGRPLAGRELVHHFDGNGWNNAPSNLVLCPDDAYHKLLHLRQRALEGCGNANWWKCVFCHQWDDPENMRADAVQPNRSTARWMHRKCYSDYKHRNKHKWASTTKDYHAAYYRIRRDKMQAAK